MLCNSEYGNVRALAELVLQKHGRVHVLVNNAAITHSANLLAASPQQIERTIRVDLLAYFWVRLQFCL